MSVAALVPVHAAQMGCTSPTQIKTLAAGETLSVHAAASGYLLVRELGVNLLWSDATERWQGVDFRPPRLGLALIPVVAGQTIALQAARPQIARLSLERRCTADLNADDHCLIALDSAVRGADLASIERSAKLGGRCAAFAMHELAQRASNAGALVLAHRRYQQVAQRWAALGDMDRHAAALLGLAEQSIDAGYSARALQEAILAQTRNEDSGLAIYATRAKLAQAIALGRLGKSQVAQALLQRALAEFASYGEMGEVANVRNNMAVDALLAGNWQEVDRQMAAIAALDAALQTPVIQARIAQMRAYREIAAGRLSVALAHYEQAISLSETAGAQANVAIVAASLADLYRSLGMYDEAYAQLARAFSVSPAGEAPQLTATFLANMAALDLDAGRLHAARHWAAAAQNIYQLLEFPIEQQWTQAVRLDIDLRLGAAPAAVIEEIQTMRRDGRAAIAYTCATLANALTAQARPAEALASLDLPGCVPRTLNMAVDLIEARALANGAAGRPEDAQQQLLSYAQSLSALLPESNAGVSYAALRRLDRLRGTWLHLEKQRTSASDLAERALAFALATHVHQSALSHLASAPSASTAIGALLLSDDPRGASNAASAAVLKTLARSAGAKRGSRRDPRLADLQIGLQAGQWLLVPLLAAKSGLAIWISRDRVHTTPIAGQAVLREVQTRLQAALQSPSTPIVDVNAIARELSAALLSGAPSGAAPTQLSVLADDSIAATPLVLLPWPGADRPLIETTDLSWITRLPHTLAPDSAALGVPPAIQVFVAANTGKNANPKLAALPNADLEPEWIAAAQPNLILRRSVGAKANRAALTAALQAPGSIVHLAVHGYARPNLLGYAGVWLAPAADTLEPQFLSWLDIADLPLSADLAVLNACQLGAGASSLSFAAAVSGAGVAHVIAASWPVSDAASDTWISAFYGALDPLKLDSSAAALRQAQLALKQRRQFRHPYFWASLAHWRNLDLPPRADF